MRAGGLTTRIRGLCPRPAARHCRAQGSYSRHAPPAGSARRRAALAAAAAVDAETGPLAAAAEELFQQQNAPQQKPVHDAVTTRVLVETAMFAAVGGLAFSVAAVLKLQGYLGYLLPMPIVLAAMRSGPAVARKTLTATAVLLFVLLGPLQAVNYLLRDGVTAWALGALWAVRAPWWASICAAATARMAGVIAFLAFTSWTLNENLYRLLVTQIHSLLDQMGAVLGASGTPSLLVIQAVLVAVLLVNCLMYVALLHVLYAILLRSMGYSAMQMPRFLERRLLPSSLHAAPQ